MIDIHLGRVCVVENLGVGVSGLSSIVRNKIKFTIESHNFKTLYDVYNINYDLPIKKWISEYKNDKDKSKNKLVELFNKEKIENSTYHLFYELWNQKEDLTLSFPSKIYCDVLRLTLDKEYKDFFILNSPSLCILNNGHLHNGFATLSLKKIE